MIPTSAFGFDTVSPPTKKHKDILRPLAYLVLNYIAPPFGLLSESPIRRIRVLSAGDFNGTTLLRKEYQFLLFFISKLLSRASSGLLICRHNGAVNI